MRSPTAVARVRHVLGATVTAEIDRTIAGVSPMFRGRVHDVGQIGSLVKIPQGTTDLIGAVTMIGIAELNAPLAPSHTPNQGDRWLQFQLLGELDTAGQFQRGVSYYPAIDDEVHFLTHDEVRSIFPSAAVGRITIGALSTDREAPIHLDLQKLVVRHSAVVGSTGAGKSSTVARILQAITSEGLNRANVVVVDIHGEYSGVLPGAARTRSVLAEDGLFVPYWSLTLDSLIDVYVPSAEKNAIIKNRLHELILTARREFAHGAPWVGIQPADISVDTPVPFDIRDVWFQLDSENHATYPQNNNAGTPCVLQLGDAATLQSTIFDNYAPGGGSPFKGKQFGTYGIFPDRLRNRLSDPRYAFLSREYPSRAGPDPLPAIISGWLGDELPVSILDFAGVPQGPADAAVGVILRAILDLAVYAPSGEGVGRARPVLIVLEEAHRFLSKRDSGASALAREGAERIAREGRKYGVGLMIVSQRPSELSETVLSQCGTLISMRLTNESDQSTIKAVLPDAVAALAEALPSLRNGEALVSGEALRLPARVQVTRPNPEPYAADPSIESWYGGPITNDLTSTVRSLRS